jgi:hypothetical protein
MSESVDNPGRFRPYFGSKAGRFRPIFVFAISQQTKAPLVEIPAENVRRWGDGPNYADGPGQFSMKIETPRRAT